MALSVAIAQAVVWFAIAASYETDYPVGFFVGTASAAAFILGRLWVFARTRFGRRGTPVPAETAAGGL
jgi:zinc/manganese transport system permease protein